MDKLQFKIASTICARSTMPSGQAVTIAAALLALPEIKEALKAHERLVGKPSPLM